jgi:H/ACA ribonucleoprotein complex subunit 4
MLARRDAISRFGKNPEERSVKELLDYGIVVIDKPKGPTTHQVADYVKKILNIGKCGHSGSLDPAVTGVVVIGLGKSTKVVHNLLRAGKEYVCIMHVHHEISEDEIKKAMKSFVGEVTQLPPLKSAVKRVERERTIYYINILEIDRQDVLFKVGCQAGTYIRKLCYDIGKKLGTGAHMAELRRTKVGNLDEKYAVSLQDLSDACAFWKEGDETEIKKILLPMEKAVEHMQKIVVLDSAVDALCHGAKLNVPGIAKLDGGILRGDYIAVMTLKGELIMTGTAQMSSTEIEKKDKGIAVTPERVFMESRSQSQILPEQ